MRKILGLLLAVLALAAGAVQAQNNALFVSQSVPSAMLQNQSYAVSVTMQNTGSTTWTAGTGYKLGSVGTLTGIRVAPPSSVAPGQSVTFSFNVTAPGGASSTRTFQWQMIQEGVEWFGPTTPSLAVNVGNHATFVSQSVPPAMLQSQSYAVSVTMQNTGATTWPAGAAYKLGSIGTLTGIRVAPASPVAPGQSTTFSFNVTAPGGLSNAYSFQWQMVQEGSEWFGPSTPSTQVAVGNHATFVSQSVPEHMAPGQVYPVNVKLRNTGLTSWTTAGNYRLIPKNPDHNNRWGLTFVGLPGGNTVNSGDEVTFSFNVTAPTTAGLHSFQWKMDKFGTEQFGDLTPNVAVDVGVGGAEFVSQTVPFAMVAGQTYPVNVTLRNTGLTTWTNAANYRLIPKNPDHNNRWGLTFVSMPSSIAPGATASFDFNVTAPTTAGAHSFQWMMDKFGTAQFGQMSPNVNVGVGIDDALFVSQNVPAVMQPGLTYPVTVTMRNTGGALWTSAAGYKLRSQNPTGNGTWGLNEVALPASVGADATTTFSFNVTAPSFPGTYNFQWRMAHGATLFGALSSNVQVVNGQDAASFVAQNVTSAMIPGQTYPVSVTMKNTGGSTWSPGAISLGAVNPVDNTTWGLNRVALASSVAPGANATFNFNVTAPSTPGSHNFQWRMVQGASGFFSAAAPNVAVQVAGDNAAFVSQSVPAQMSPGQSYNVSVTLTNTGASTWSPDSQFRLGSVNPVDNTTWSLSRADLPADVPPGTSVTIPFNVVAPATAGTYNFQWQMLHDATAFGATTQNVAVSVGAASPLAGMMFIHVDHLNTPRAIFDSAQQLRWTWEQQEPFGVNPPDENPSSLGAYEFNLRFPGQYADKETNLHYNYFRDFDPVLGRYQQSDPMGLAGGADTYSYVNGSPLAFADPTGELSVAACGNPANAPACIAAGIIVGPVASMLVAGAINSAIQYSQNGCVDPTQLMDVMGDAGQVGMILGPFGGIRGFFPATAAAAARTKAAPAISPSPTVGGGANLGNLPPAVAQQIQNAANRTGTSVTLVGSRARGNPGPNSDFDYILQPGAPRNIKSSLPSGPRNLGGPRNQDFHPGPVDPNKPHIIFHPRQ
jgi:RHS repeat-associated protein